MPRNNLETNVSSLERRAYSKSMARKAKAIGEMLTENDKLQSNSPELWARYSLSELGLAKT